ncbi:hypothetical protein CRYUN_Cryun23aG0050600 [Craigia yunnanensis]
MGRKTRAFKSRPSNSIPPLNPSLISLPLRCQDEANEEYHVVGKDHGASEKTGSSQDNKHNNKNDVDGNDDVYLDDDDEEEEEEKKDGDNVVVPDSVEKVDRHAGGNHAAGPNGDCVVVDWLEGKFCIRCKSGSGQVLICSENGCPVAIHKVCMNCEPKFDDLGKFYCPYCCYKRELERTKELRRKAMLAKKELSNFICLRKDGGNEEKQEDKTVDMKGDETQGVESISKEKSDEESISRADGFANVGNGERIQEEDIENSSDSEDDEIDKDRWQIRPSSSSHLGIVKGTLHLSTKETSDVVGVLEEDQGKRGKEKPVLLNVVGTTTALISRDATSKVPAIESFEFVSPGLDTETLVVRQQCAKQTAQKAQPLKVYSPNNPSFQPCTSAKDTEINQEGEATTAKNSVPWQESNKRLMIPTVGTEKRRRLHWTAEEEDMLKEGVRRFSTKVNKNIPWRKILEYGHNVFHVTRTPVDLKDKWKNIMAKEAPSQKQ